MTREVGWIGFHIVRPTTGGWQLPRAAIVDSFEALGLRLAQEAPPPWERLVFHDQAGAPVTLHIDTRPGWTQFTVQPIDRARFVEQGADAFERLFETLCVMLDAHLARSYQHGGWALVNEGELGGPIDALDWLQYVGPRLAHWTQEWAQHSSLMTARVLSQGAAVLRLGVDPFAPSWRERTDVAEDIRMALRPLPEAAQAELTHEARLLEVLPPEPDEWRPEQRDEMLAARAETYAQIDAGIADSRLFDRFRALYLPDGPESALLDRLSTWLFHYGDDETSAALRGVARIHEEHPDAPAFDTVSLEGCVKLVSWVDNGMPMTKRELLLHYNVDLPELVVPKFARNATDHDVIGGMVTLAALHVETCKCDRCGELRKVLATIAPEPQA